MSRNSKISRTGYRESNQMSDYGGEAWQDRAALRNHVARAPHPVFRQFTNKLLVNY